jgi:hypothetical protein
MPCKPPAWDDFGQTFESGREYEGPAQVWYYMVDGRQQRIRLRECRPTDTTEQIKGEIEAHIASQAHKFSA